MGNDFTAVHRGFGRHLIPLLCTLQNKQLRAIISVKQWTANVFYGTFMCQRTFDSPESQILPLTVYVIYFYDARIILTCRKSSDRMF